MATSRHQRRKAAQARLLAKSERIGAAAHAFASDQRSAVVRGNLSQTPERNRHLTVSSLHADRLMVGTHKGFSLGPFGVRPR